MSENEKNQNTEAASDSDAATESAPEEAEQSEQSSAQTGPTFTQGPDPLAGVKKGASDAMASMEGKTVSMKLYVGSIIGVIVLMLLARCGG